MCLFVEAVGKVLPGVCGGDFRHRITTTGEDDGRVTDTRFSLELRGWGVNVDQDL